MKRNKKRKYEYIIYYNLRSNATQNLNKIIKKKRTESPTKEIKFIGKNVHIYIE